MISATPGEINNIRARIQCGAIIKRRLARRRGAGRPNESRRSRPGRHADDDGKIGVSARAYSRTSPRNVMSVLPPKADIAEHRRDVR